VDRAPGDRRIRSGEVDVFEDAARGRGGREVLGADAVGVDRHHLARLHLADEGGAHDVERRRLRGDHPAALEPAEYQGPDAVRVAGGVERVLVHEDQGERAAQPGQDLLRRGLERVVGVPGEQRREDRGVRGAALGEFAPLHGAVALLDQADEVGSVGEVAVVRQRDRAGRRRPERGLGVVPGAGAGGGVARVPDGEVPLEGVERALVEHLGDQAHVLVDEDLRPVARGDARRLLAPVLQRVEAEVREFGDLLAGRPDPEDAAGVLRALFTGKEVVGQPTVSARHRPMVTHPTPGPVRGLLRSAALPPERAPVRGDREEHPGQGAEAAERKKHEQEDRPAAEVLRLRAQDRGERRDQRAHEHAGEREPPVAGGLACGRRRGERRDLGGAERGRVSRGSGRRVLRCRAHRLGLGVAHRSKGCRVLRSGVHAEQATGEPEEAPPRVPWCRACSTVES